MVVGSEPDVIVKMRGTFIRAMIAAGHRVTAVAAFDDPAARATLEGGGAAYRVVPMQRNGLNPVADLKTLWSLYRLMRAERPDVVFSYTLKPVVYGLVAATLARVPGRFAMIAGRGYAFLEGPELKRRLSRVIATLTYRISLATAHGVAFQNEDDRAFFRDNLMIGSRTKTVRIYGSGVELTRFAHAPLPDGPPRFLMIARLLRDKGIDQYIGAARLLRTLKPDARCLLVGPLDPSPNGFTSGEVEGWVKDGVIDYAGEVADVRPALRAAHVYVLPSRGEGMPRSTLEALAIGRAVVTTDVPGCRDTVKEGWNGFLVPVDDTDALAAAMAAAAADPETLARMGQASRELAETLFDVDKVNADLMAMMGLMTAKAA